MMKLVFLVSFSLQLLCATSELSVTLDKPGGSFCLESHSNLLTLPAVEGLRLRSNSTCLALGYDSDLNGCSQNKTEYCKQWSGHLASASLSMWGKRGDEKQQDEVLSRLFKAAGTAGTLPYSDAMKSADLTFAWTLDFSRFGSRKPYLEAYDCLQTGWNPLGVLVLAEAWVTFHAVDCLLFRCLLPLKLATGLTCSDRGYSVDCSKGGPDCSGGMGDIPILGAFEYQLRATNVSYWQPSSSSAVMV